MPEKPFDFDDRLAIDLDHQGMIFALERNARCGLSRARIQQLISGAWLGL